MKSGSLHDYVLLVILSAIWGASFLFIKIAIVEVTPVTMAAVRIVIALGLLYVIARMKGHSLKRPSGREGWIMWGHFLFIGMLGNLFRAVSESAGWILHYPWVFKKVG